MGLKEVLNSDRGKIIVVVLIGFGLSTFFRKECKDQSCVQFKAPAMSEIDGKIFQYNTKCYRFSAEPANCKKNKKTILF